MSEQVDRTERDARAEGSGESQRRSSVPLIAALLAILVLGVVVGYVLATTRASGESDVDETAAPTSAEPVATSTMQAQRPVAVALDGVALTPLSGPPEGTMAMLETSTVDADATYAVTFRPYGYGPSGGSSSVVVRIERATPQTKGAEGFDMSGRNVLVTVLSLIHI